MLPEKYPNKSFLVPNLGTFVFSKVLQWHKFEGCVFKYGKRFWKFQPPKNTQISYVTSKIEAIFFFHEISHLDKFEDADFKYENSFLKMFSKNTQ